MQRAGYILGMVVAAAVALPSMAALAPPSRDTAPVPDRLAVLDAVATLGDAQGPDEPFCARPAQMEHVLSASYEEQRQTSRPRADGTRLDLWASTDLGTWTLVYLRRDGMACVVDSGTGTQDYGNNAVQSRLIAEGSGTG